MHYTEDLLFQNTSTDIFLEVKTEGGVGKGRSVHCSLDSPSCPVVRITHPPPPRFVEKV